MKIILLIAFLSGTSFLIYNFMGDDAQASIEVIKEKFEKKLVQAAGEGEVALKLMQKEYAGKRQQLIKLKTLRKSFERRITRLESEAAEMDSKEASSKLKLAESYQIKLDSLTEKEKRAESLLLEFKEKYSETKKEIRSIQEELAATQALSRASGSSEPDLSHLEGKDEKIHSLVEALRVKLDNAEAVIDVHDLESELNL